MIKRLDDLGATVVLNTTNPDVANALNIIERGVFAKTSHKEKSTVPQGLAKVGPFQISHLDSQHHLLPGALNDASAVAESVIGALKLAKWPEKYQELFSKVFWTMNN